MADNSNIQMTLTINGIEKNVTDLNTLKSTLSENGIKMDDLGKSAEVTSNKLEKIGGSTNMFKLLGGSVGETAEKFKTTTEVIEKVNNGFKLMKVAIIETGIGALVVVLGAVISYLKSTTDGSDKLSAALAYVRGFVQPLINGFREFGDAVLHPVEGIKKLGDSIKNFFGDIIKDLGNVIDDIKNGKWAQAAKDALTLLKDTNPVTKALGSVIEKGNEMGQQFADLEVQTRKLDRAEKEYGATSVRIHGQIREAMLKARDPKLSPLERSKELNTAVALEKKDSETLIGFVRQRMSILEQENKHGKVVGDEYFNQKAELNKKLAELEAERDDKLTQLQVKDDRLQVQSTKKTETELAKKERLHNEFLSMMAELQNKEDQTEVNGHEKRIKLIDDNYEKLKVLIKSKHLEASDEQKLLDKADQVHQSELNAENRKDELEAYAQAKADIKNFYAEKKTLLETALANNQITDTEFRKQNLQNQKDENADALIIAKQHLDSLAENDIEGRQKANNDIINLQLQQATINKAIRDEDFKDEKTQLDISHRDGIISKTDYYIQLLALDEKYGKDASEIRKKYRDKEKNSLNQDVKEAEAAIKNIATFFTNQLNEQSAQIDKRYTNEKKEIDDNSKYQIDTIKNTSDIALQNESLSSQQKNLIKQKALKQEQQIQDKAKADELAAQQKADAEKKELAKKAAAIQLAINIATIAAQTGQAIMKDFADPELLPPFDAIAAAAAGALGATQLVLAIQQYDKVQSLGTGTIDENSRLIGPSHQAGGIRIGNSIVEGGEGIIKKTAMNNPTIGSLVKAINKTDNAQLSNIRVTPAGSLVKSPSVVPDKTEATKVYVLEKDITLAQQKISKIQKGAVL